MTLKKKVCMLGACAVGKTSLVRRFVQGIFTEKYHSTLGVKIDRKDVRVGDTDLSMMLWDLHGDDDTNLVRPSFLRATAGVLLVVDGTRRETFERALTLQKRAVETAGEIPFVMLLNKADLSDAWQLNESDYAGANDPGWPILKTSAKTGEHVEEAFTMLADALVSKPPA